jgi:hypothetical protein
MSVREVALLLFGCLSYARSIIYSRFASSWYAIRRPAVARYRFARRKLYSLALAFGLVSWLAVSAGPAYSRGVLTSSAHVPAPTSLVMDLPSGTAGQLVQLGQLPVHLWQWNPAPDAYNPMGCGAFTTAMALSTYEPDRFGTYQAANSIFAQMPKIPLIGGTFEGDNAKVAGLAGFAATTADHGTAADLMTAIDAGAPVILLVNPIFLGLGGLGLHDVLLVGYRLDAAGMLQDVFVDDPAFGAAGGADPNAPGAPGNRMITMAELQQSWTGVFTPVFRTVADEQHWQKIAGR